MSLDVYLQGDPEQYECAHCGQTATRRPDLYEANITRNLVSMAEAAGVYEACWRPEDIHIETAAQLIPLLEAGIAKMKADPERLKLFDSPNGWGLYKNFLPWLEHYLEACREHPQAIVKVSR